MRRLQAATWQRDGGVAGDNHRAHRRAAAGPGRSCRQRIAGCCATGCPGCRTAGKCDVSPPNTGDGGLVGVGKSPLTAALVGISTLVFGVGLLVLSGRFQRIAQGPFQSFHLGRG